MTALQKIARGQVPNRKWGKDARRGLPNNGPAISSRVDFFRFAVVFLRSPVNVPVPFFQTV